MTDNIIERMRTVLRFYAGHSDFGGRARAVLTEAEKLGPVESIYGFIDESGKRARLSSITRAPYTNINYQQFLLIRLVQPKEPTQPDIPGSQWPAEDEEGAI